MNNRLSENDAKLVFEEMFAKWNAALQTAFDNIQEVNRTHPKGTPGRDAALLKAVDPIVNCYTKDATLMPTLQNEICTTPEEIGRYFIHFAEKNPKGTITKMKLFVKSDNEIFVIGDYRFDLKDPTTKEPSSAMCNYTYNIVQDTDSGEWKWGGHVSRLFPVPLPEEPKREQKPAGNKNAFH